MKRTLRNCMLAVSVILLGVSCDEVLDQLNISFEVTADNVVFTVNEANAGDLFESVDVVNEDLQKEVEDNGGNIDNLDEVKVKEVTITIASGATDFNAIDSLVVYIESDGLAKIELASIENVPADTTELKPIVTDVNLKDYIAADEYTVTLTGKLTEDVTNEITLNANIIFDVNL